MKKLLIGLIAIVGIAALFALTRTGGGGADGAGRVVVERGTIVRQAVAVGRVEPSVEVPVKSRNGGVLSQRFVALGDRVERDAPLVEVRPLLTDQERLAAERALLAATDAEENVVEYSEAHNLVGRLLLLGQGEDNVDRMRRSAERARKDAEAQLQLLLEGAAEIDGKVIDYVVRAPASGHVIEMLTEIGQPIVPSSSFGSGTVLLTLADMDRPVFRGTVDEIDVGRLENGMPATLTIGALPGVELAAELTEISLRARRVNNAVVFDVELSVEPPEDLVLRAGFSAVARIDLERAADCLVLPERVVEFRDAGAFVQVPGDGGEPEDVAIETGVSDGLRVEILAGLEEGQEVLERTF